MTARQRSTVCNFVLRYIWCELPEDTVDVMVKVRTMWGTHMLKEDRDNCTLKFRPWSMRTKPFETLKQRLNRYVKRRWTVAAAAAVTPFLQQVMNQGIKGEYNRLQPRIQPMNAYGCFSFCLTSCNLDFLRNRTHIFSRETSFCQFSNENH